MKMNKGLYFVLLLTAATAVASAQVATGIPPFSTVDGGPFDRVNLGNLNVEFAIPILSKPGRGIPFNFSLVYNSSVWAISSGKWVPAGGTVFGWQGTEGTFTPVISYWETFIPHACGSTGQLTFQESTFNQFAYIDQLGGQHSYGNLQAQYIYNSPGPSNNCPPNGPVNGTQTSTASDGSGYTLTLNAPGQSAPTGYVVDRSGDTINAPLVANGGSPGQSGYTIQDPNGNQLTYSGSTGVFTDTMGMPVLTVGASAATYTYTAPGGSATYSVQYEAYPIQTAFGCSGVKEFSNVGQSGNILLLTSIRLPDGTFYTFNYETTPGNSNYYTGRIKSVTLPTGGQITYNYTGSNYGISCTDGSTTGLTRTLTPGGTWTYSHFLVSGGHWRTIVTSPSDPQNAGSPPPGDDTVLDFQKDPSTSNLYETHRQAYQGPQSAGNLLLNVFTCYNGNTSNCPTTAVSTPITERTVIASYPNNGQASQVNNFYDPTFGLLTETDEYAYGPNGVPGSLARKTQISYANLVNIVDHPAGVTVTDGSGNLLSKTTYGYDEYSSYPLQPSSGTPQHGSVSSARGNATTVTSTVIGSTTLSTHFEYFDTGTVYESIDAKGSITTYNYPDPTSTCGNSFPASISLPISGLSTSTVWNCNGGVATSVTDANGNPSNATYTDPSFWRPASVQDPTGATTTFSYTPYSSSSQALAHRDSQMLFNNNASVVEQLATVNQFGQPVYSQKRQGPNSSNWDSTQVLYDSFLRPNQASMPCISTATTFTAQNQACPSSATTTSTFDALGRVAQTTDGGGGYVKYTYNQNDVLTALGPAPTNENLKQRQLEYDALGRLTKVCELTTSIAGAGTCSVQGSPSGYLTTYTYGTTPIGSNAYPSMTVTQNAQASSGQQTRTYVYDLLGRLVQEANPESGTTTYTFDTDSTCGSSAGDLVKKQDANGNTICYSYDAMHRMLATTYSGPNSTGVNRYFVYDTATVNNQAMANAKGRTAEGYTATCSTCSKVTDDGFSYSVRGELANFYESTPHSAGYYSVPITYFANGTTQTVGFLGGQVGYTVDAEGRIYGMTDGFTSSTAYNAASQPTQVMTSCHSGTCYPLAYSYNPNTGRMTQYSATVVSNSTNYAISGTMTWNTNGSLGQLVISDPLNAADNQTCNYAADDLSRIASVNCGSVWAQNFTYDPFGNITKSGSVSWMPGYNSSTNRYALAGTSYDNDGNVLYDTLDRYTWDAENRPLSAVLNNNGGETWSYTYDAFGHMVELAIDGSYSGSYIRLGGFKLSATGQTPGYSEYPLPGGATRSFNGGGTGYNFADWLGTMRGFYGFTGAGYSQSGAHAPFGEAYAYSGGYPGEFTGQGNNGVGTSNGDLTYYFPEREYRSSQGRWNTPDPAGLAAANPANPQSWNRYAYVLNNPMALVDPSGLQDCSLLGASFRGGPGCQNPGPGCITSYCPTAYGGMAWNDPVNPNAIMNYEQQVFDQCAKVNFQCDSEGNYKPPSGNSITVHCSGTFSSFGCAAPPEAIAGPETVGFLTSIGMQGQLAQLAEYQADPMLYKDVIRQLGAMSGAAEDFIIYGYAGSLVGSMGGALVRDAAEIEEGVFFGTRAGGNTPLFNSNDYFRVGWSYIRASDEYVFRIGGDLVPDFINDGHINLWPPSWWF